MSARATIDVSGLSDHAFGNRSVMWWATFLIILIETTVFAITIASYFYIQGNEVNWPPEGTPLPGLFWPTVNLGLMLLSLVPNQLAKNAAERYDTHKVRIWIIVADLFAIAFVVVRAFEFGQLRVSWDSSGYGSVVWTLLGFHTFHVVTDLFDSLVLTVLMFTKHGYEPKRLVDVSENCFYWYFVVMTWMPIYAVLYWAPRLL